MRLEIYIARHCENCAEALRLAELARGCGIAGLDVDVISLDQPSRPIPRRVVAVPAYLLDGQLISLGNPYPDELLARLRRHREEDTP